jgi:hypothetical protein
MWTGAVLAVIFLPPLVSLVYDLCRRPRDTLWRQHIRASLRRCGMQFSHAMLMLVFLPYEAWFSMDAILRSLWRTLVSHRRMLEWRASALARQAAGAASTWRTMWSRRCWRCSSAARCWAGVPPACRRPRCSCWRGWWRRRWPTGSAARSRATRAAVAEQHASCMLARRTWAYFERFVGPEDHWLPPDNMQEHPVQVVAHRTSPTNIGMALLANLTASDFGYITVGQLMTRTANTLDSMDQLERYQGHFYNWYDTQTLKPLHPMYMSTVDSGNLAGHLLTLQPGLTGLYDAPVLGPQDCGWHHRHRQRAA